MVSIQFATDCRFRLVGNLSSHFHFQRTVNFAYMTEITNLEQYLRRSDQISLAEAASSWKPQITLEQAFKGKQSEGIYFSDALQSLL